MTMLRNIMEVKFSFDSPKWADISGKMKLIFVYVIITMKKENKGQQTTIARVLLSRYLVVISNFPTLGNSASDLNCIPLVASGLRKRQHPMR